MERASVFGLITLVVALIGGLSCLVWAALLAAGRVRPSRHWTRTVRGAVLYGIGYPMWLGAMGGRLWLDPHVDGSIWFSIVVQVAGMALAIAGNIVERRAKRRAEAAENHDSVLAGYYHPPTLPR